MQYSQTSIDASHQPHIDSPTQLRDIETKLELKSQSEMKGWSVLRWGSDIYPERIYACTHPQINSDPWSEHYKCNHWALAIMDDYGSLVPYHGHYCVWEDQRDETLLAYWGGMPEFSLNEAGPWELEMCFKRNSPVVGPQNQFATIVWCSAQCRYGVVLESGEILYLSNLNRDQWYVISAY